MAAASSNRVMWPRALREEVGRIESRVEGLQSMLGAAHAESERQASAAAAQGRMRVGGINHRHGIKIVLQHPEQWECICRESGNLGLFNEAYRMSGRFTRGFQLSSVQIDSLTSGQRMQTHLGSFNFQDTSFKLGEHPFTNIH